MHANRRAVWTVADLAAADDWTVRLDDRARADLAAAVRGKRDPDRDLLDYRRGEFDLGAARLPLEAALAQAKTGTGFALVKGAPREGLTADEFELLTWAIGLHAGVARPQGKATHYMAAVRDVGTNYRSADGRGYSSNAELDFHTDGADVVLLSCYNTAREGGMSMVTSSIAALEAMERERGYLAELLRLPHHFSRQREQAPDEGPFYPNPVFDERDGLVFSKWNRNRLRSAQDIDGVPRLDARRWEALDALDATLRRPDLMHAMWLEPGDIQILNNHTTLHSRTEFVDFEEAERKRTLYRLWLAPPDSVRLPDSWLPAYRSVEAGTVRGGILGQAYDDRRREYEERAARDLGMAA